MSSKALRPSRARVGLLLLPLLVAGACGSGDDTEVAAGREPAEEAATAAPATAAPAADTPTDDAALAAAAMLTPDDFGEGWSSLGTTFPHDVELARTVPECAAFADVVFEGGSRHGASVGDLLVAGNKVVILYAIVFPTEDGAVALLDAVATPEFDACWAPFNEVASVAMGVGISAASYESLPPPELDVEADAVVVKLLDGTTTIDGTILADTCLCMFARVGRGVVMVHSPETALTIPERNEYGQLAVDKMRAVLANG